jgi:hypothetical protein
VNLRHVTLVEKGVQYLLALPKLLPGSLQVGIRDR